MDEVGGASATTGFSFLRCMMAGKMEPLPGTSDTWEPETSEWVFLEDSARKVFARYGYGELRTPVFERTDVFVRGIGDQTEVVQKEMYTFEDRGGRSLTLRPEGTAGVMRAIVNQGLAPGDEKRVFYIGPMFRGERPAAGRKRQFHQVGVEAVGRCAPAMDAENIIMLMHYLQQIEVSPVRLLLNTRGTAADRESAARVYHDYFAAQTTSMCEDCQRRLETNIWRIMDCKQAACQAIIEQAPAMTDLVSADSRAFFNEVCSLLDAVGAKYEIAPRLVRGLDYYEHTVFEVVCEGENLGAQNAVAGGGRYLISVAGNKTPVAGVGFALGMERLLLARGQGAESEPRAIGEIDIYVASLGPEAMAAGLALAQALREDGYRVLTEVEGRSMKAQMRTANKVNAEIALIRGESELANGTVMCKAMNANEQVELPLAEVAEWVKGKMTQD
jgi:histidyl-tRNA synthetase